MNEPSEVLLAWQRLEAISHVEASWFRAYLLTRVRFAEARTGAAA